MRCRIEAELAELLMFYMRIVLFIIIRSAYLSQRIFNILGYDKMDSALIGTVVSFVQQNNQQQHQNQNSEVVRRVVVQIAKPFDSIF